MNRLSAWLGLATCALASGCVFYSSDDDCQFGGAAIAALPDVRNPDTGQCEPDWSGGGGGGGGGSCGVVNGGADPAPSPDWATCNGVCESLDESTCLVTSGCRAAYISDCVQGTPCATENFSFYQCWGTAPSGPVEGGGCDGLDAYTCSLHDDCVAQHFPGMATCVPDADPACTPSGVGNFERCVPEPIGCYAGDDCGEGSHCSTDDGECLTPPGCSQTGSDGLGVPVSCPGLCYGFCVPDVTAAGHCYGAVTCDLQPPDCPDGTVPGIGPGGCYTGECIAIKECPEGTCYGEVVCESPEPVCETGLRPGIANGCYTGYCIPIDQCPDQPDCSALDEASCIARSDCAPYYQGSDCSCTGDVCDCTTWTFLNCQRAP